MAQRHQETTLETFAQHDAAPATATAGKDNGHDVDVLDLEHEDAIVLPSGDVLIVRGRASGEDLADDHGPVYEVRVEDAEGDLIDHRILRPYHFERALDAGAEGLEHYIVAPAAPFVCDGCSHPTLGEDRHATIAEYDVCSYGCKRFVQKRRHRERMASKLEGEEGE